MNGKSTATRHTIIVYCSIHACLFPPSSLPPSLRWSLSMLQGRVGYRCLINRSLCSDDAYRRVRMYVYEYNYAYICMYADRDLHVQTRMDDCVCVCVCVWFYMLKFTLSLSRFISFFLQTRDCAFFLH